jgi:rare lipoprotein A
LFLIFLVGQSQAQTYPRYERYPSYDRYLSYGEEEELIKKAWQAWQDSLTAREKRQQEDLARQKELESKAQLPAQTDNTELPSRYYQTGQASYYAEPFHGRLTASGEIYDMNEMTAAHRSLPFGTRIKVTNEENGKSVVVTITDRGPYVQGRIIDLSKEAAGQLGAIRDGVIPVTLEIVSPSFVWPTRGRSITQRYGVFSSITNSYHYGIDIDGVTGDPIYAAASGQVVYSGWNRGNGNYVVIDHEGGLITVYKQLSWRDVTAGQEVNQGQVIGLMGSSGVSTGSHLHYEIWQDGRRVNPLTYLGLGR